jgi:Hsp90 protein
MGSDQSDIFYITGTSRVAVEVSPYMEAVREKRIEVLYMLDPVDELVLQYVFEFGGKHLKSIAKGLIELGNPEERSQDAERIKTRSQEYKPLMDKLQTLLNAEVKEVRLSSRLRESPACLVVEDHDFSSRLERLLQTGGKTGLKQKRVLELNPDHPITRFALEHFRRDPEDAVLAHSAQLLFGLVQIAEGSELTEPVQFTKAAVEILEKALSGSEEDERGVNWPKSNPGVPPWGLKRYRSLQRRTSKWCGPGAPGRALIPELGFLSDSASCRGYSCRSSHCSWMPLLSTVTPHRLTTGRFDARDRVARESAVALKYS